MKKISIDKGFNIIQKQLKTDQILASLRRVIGKESKSVMLFMGILEQYYKKISKGSVDIIFTDLPIVQQDIYFTRILLKFF